MRRSPLYLSLLMSGGSILYLHTLSFLALISTYFDAQLASTDTNWLIFHPKFPTALHFNQLRIA